MGATGGNHPAVLTHDSELQRSESLAPAEGESQHPLSKRGLGKTPREHGSRETLSEFLAAIRFNVRVTGSTPMPVSSNATMPSRLLEK